MHTGSMDNDFRGYFDEFKITLMVVYLFLSVLQNICMARKSLIYSCNAVGRDLKYLL